MVLRRILSVIPILLIVTFLVALLSTFLPGDIATTLAGPDADSERIEEVREVLRIDRPVTERWWDWTTDAVQGDLGTSYFTRRTVTREIADRWSITGSLVLGAVIVSSLIGVPLGVLAGVYRGGVVDRAATLSATLGVSVPHFVIGIFGLVIFAKWLDWLPFANYAPVATNGYVGWAKHLAIPVFALSGSMIAELTRQLRSAVSEELESDYIRTARAKGLSERVVVLKHGLRLAVLPAISVLSVQITRLFGGAVIVEFVFSLGGLGQYTADAVLKQDFPVIQGIVPLAVIIAVTMSLLADLTFLKLNPRLRAEGA